MKFPLLTGSMRYSILLFGVVHPAAILSHPICIPGCLFLCCQLKIFQFIAKIALNSVIFQLEIGSSIPFLLLWFMTLISPPVHAYAFSNVEFHPISITPLLKISWCSLIISQYASIMLMPPNYSKILRDVFDVDSLMWNFDGLLCCHPNCYSY